jgi:hypothetical protein
MNSRWRRGGTPGIWKARDAAQSGWRGLRCVREHWRTVATCIAITCALGACGDDAGGGSADSARSARKLSALSASDRKVVCTAYITALDQAFTQPEYERLACTRQSGPVSFQVDQDGMLKGNVPQCQRLVGECIQRGGTFGDEVAARTLGEDLVDADSCEAGDEFQACDQTVREFERCTKAFASEVQERLGMVSCDALADNESIDRIFGMSADSAALPECEAFTPMSCPNLTFDSNVDGVKK